ncbi:MAG: ribose 5-phosphate isomerase B [Clostridiales bacterium]|nr:ribose 5-phosphate isomerase B [Clostridiales bacterium]MBO4747137.1 ribose 5-phosphate isomerase B [Clostridiales bacterium]MBR4819904.1 ribose 5-phosphate isomerase B [Clostridiales bacterium]MBR5041276.1 ribose 5-phosphate isomerase B [Clostridiales bacterium]MBR5418363.1 ribose 5-phosphate isomerase B [Clostridiales bacterium]
MVVSIASDHAGYPLRRDVADYLSKQGHTVIEGGATSADVPYSYVLAGQKVSKDVLEGTAERGIVICGTGIGISMVANKFPGIRCALCTNEFMSRMCRQHNDANVLSMGARVIGKGVAFGIVDAFMNEPFDGGRHMSRVNDMKEQEKELFK